MRVWRERNTALNSNNVHGTTAYGGGGVTVWGCFSNDCKLPLQVIDGTLNGQKYRDDILDSHVLPHFENHALADRPVFQDDNARTHRARIVRELKQSSLKHFHCPPCHRTWTWSNMYRTLSVVKSISDNRNVKTWMNYGSLLSPNGRGFHSIGFGVWSGEWGGVLNIYTGSAEVIPDTNDLNVKWQFMYS